MIHADTCTGFFKVYKKPGISSYDVIRVLKKRISASKIGHTGTLDPFAEGLIVILTGSMVKLFNIFNTLNKTYRATAVFGYETDTLDNTGTIISEAPAPSDISAIENIINDFTGTITQKPPDYSAAHVKGKRAYELARKGISPDLKEKKVEVHSIDIHSYADRKLDFSITCSSGTYIRSLARDIGIRCNSKAYLEKLKRLSIGNFILDSDASLPENISENNLILPNEGLKLLDIPFLTVKNNYKDYISNGKTLMPDYFETEPGNCVSAVFNDNLDFLALIDNSDIMLKYIFVNPENSIYK